MNDIYQVLNSHSFNWIWCGFTALYFLYWLSALLYRTGRIRGALRRVAKPLASILGADAFAKSFEAYSKTVSKEPFLRHAWAEYTETLVFPREGESSRVRNTVEPGLFFNDATIVQPVVHNRFLDTVPSHLVGLGILGTFLGLFAGVGLATDGLRGATPEEITNSLGDLLQGASLAFSTSIVGLGASLLFLWIERSLVGRVHRRIGAWVEKLEACVELVSVERIALQQLEQSKRQTKQLEAFSDQLVFALDKALDERVAQRLGPQLDKLITATEGLRADRAEANVGVMRQLVEEFTRKLDESTGTEMNQIGLRLQALGDGLKDLTASLDRAAQGLSSQMTAAGQQIRNSGQETAAGITAAVAAFSESLARLERATVSQGEFASRVDALAASMRGAGESVVEAHRRFSDSLEQSRQLASRVEAAATRISDSTATTTGVAQQLAETARAMQTQQERLTATWEDYQGRFADIDRSLQGFFQGVVDGVDQYAQKVTAFHTELDQQLGRATGALGAAVGELNDAIEDLGEKLRR